MVDRKLLEFWEKEWSQEDDIGSTLYHIPVNNDSGKRILNLGCGSFYALGNSIYGGPKATFVGSDISLSALRRAPREYNPVRSDGSCLPFKDDSFDECIANNAIGFMGEITPAVFREMARVTKGDVMFGVFHTDILKIDDSGGTRKDYDWGTVHYNGDLQRTLFTKDQLEDTLKKNSLKVVEIDVETIYQHSPSMISSVPMNIGKTNYMIIVRAQKLKL